MRIIFQGTMKMVGHGLFTLIILFVSANDTLCQTDMPCSGGTYEVVKPFIGIWEEYTVTDNGEELLGTLQSTMDLNGCVLTQRFTSSDESFSYVTFGYILPDQRIWEESYVFSNGSSAKYHWIVEGDDVLQRRVGGTRKIDYMHQLRLTVINKDLYEAMEEHSVDKGITWQKKELTRIRRKKID